MTLPRIFSSIGVKLFLSFWVITILSIAITRFVSAQLEQDSVIIPLQQNDIKKLNKIAKRLDGKDYRNINETLKRLPMRKGINILFKNEENQKVHYNPAHHLDNISRYLAKNELLQTTSVQFPFFKVSGPKKITINDTSYLMYIANRTQRPKLSAVIMSWPAWARFIIPIGVSLLLCWLLAKSLTKPILAMQKAATELGNGNYKSRVTDVTQRNDEIGVMANSFNQMADKLETNISANQRLLADVSHELRSPMTRLQIALGLINKTFDDKDKMANHIKRCEREVEQLDTMISNVLSLSRMENSFQPLQLHLINATTLISDAVDDAQYLANEKSIHIEVSPLPNVNIELDQSLIASALNNVLTNAIKYSEEKSTIRVDASLAKEMLIIDISDQGIGVSPEQIDLLFKPFYRISEARDRDTGGTGLGLAITKQAIDMHNGSISALNNDGGGLTITIKLPLKQL